MDHALPRARAYVCLAEDLGLWFKSLFIDSYKGESELLTCLHSTKSIHMKGTTAELPLRKRGPAGLEGSMGATQLLQASVAASPHPGTGAWPPISRPLSTRPWAGTRDSGKPSLAGLMGGSCPHSAKTAPQTHGFHEKI